MNPFFAPPWLDNRQAPVLHGPNFTAALPDGFLALRNDPMGFMVIPAGSAPPPVSPSLIFVHAVHPMFVGQMRQGLYAMDHPMGAWLQGMSLGIGNVQLLGPARQVPFAGGMADLREIDGVSIASGQPLRLLLMLLHGPAGSVKVVIAMNLYRWQEFFGPCLEFAGSVNLNGYGQPAPAPPVRYQVNPGAQQVSVNVGGHPFNTMPMVVHGNVVFNVNDQRKIMSNIKVGDITNSPGLAFGDGARAEVHITSGADPAELAKLIEQLKRDIQAAPIPESNKKLMLEKAVPAIAAGAKEPEKATGGIEKINDQLEGIAAGTGHVAKIAETLQKIGGLVGIGVSAAAPYLAKMMGW